MGEDMRGYKDHEASREHEANRLASGPGVGKETLTQRLAPVPGVAPSASQLAAPDRAHDVDRSLGGGAPLPDAARQRFEPQLGMDLSSVKVHDGPAAARGAEALRADAFATGSHIVFGAGQYAPESAAGAQLLGHELAHVAQQGAAGEARVDRHSSTDPRLPASQAEALTFATAANTAIQAELTGLSSATDLREQNIPALVTQLGITIGPLTPRHDSTPAAATIHFFPGIHNYAGSTTLGATTEHLVGASHNTVWIRARDHADVDNMLAAGEIRERLVRGMSEVSYTHAARQNQSAITTFEQYCARFNALYPEASFAGLSDEFNPTMDSRGPKTERSREVFKAIMAQYGTFATAYNANTAGIREQVDRYQGPESRNTLNSPGLQRLRQVFFPFAVPIPSSSYPTFRTQMTTTAQTLSSEDRAEVDRSNDWQTMLTNHLPNLTQRNEIANIIRTATPPTPAPAPTPTPAPPPGPTPAPGAITPQDFVDSVSLVGPTAPVPATGPTVPVTLTPQSVHANPSVAISSQVTVTPAASVRGPNVSPAALWPNAATTGVAATPTIAVTGPVSLDAQLALVNGPVGLTRTSPIPPVRFTVDDQRQTGFAAGWQPGVEFNNGAFQDTFVAGTSTPRYVGGAQTIGVKGTMPVAPNQNPGLTLSVRARIERGGTIIAPNQTTAYPANAAESTLVTFSIAPPTPMPAAGDAINVISDLVDAAGTTVAGSARTVAMTIGAEAVYTQAAAETVWNDDETFLHGAFLGVLTANGGAAAGLAGLVRTAANPTGQLQIHPMVQRHDSAAYVALANGGTPDPSQSAYVISTPPYAPFPDPNTLVIATGAGGWTIPSHAPYSGSFILLSRTPDVTLGVPRRGDDAVQTVAIHEASHAMDRNVGSSPFESYKTEFRAYWMDGRFGDPAVATSGSPAVFDANLTDASGGAVTIGPKSARANAIFRLQYDDPILYPYCKPNYDQNTNGFREQVDSYLTPDGINLNLSERVEALRVLFAGGVSAGFSAFRTQVQGFFSIAPAPAPSGGALSADDINYVRGSRAWRDTVNGLAGATSTQKAQLMTDMGIL
jgi:hypothetical protein